MNNKGQVLVIFVILLPVFLLILSFIIDVGTLYIDKKSVNNNAYEAVKYYLENQDEIDIIDYTRTLLKKNLKDSKISIDNNEEYIKVYIKKEHKSMYSIVLKDTDIEVIYYGYKKDLRIIKG